MFTWDVTLFDKSIWIDMPAAIYKMKSTKKSTCRGQQVVASLYQSESIYQKKRYLETF